MKSIHEYLLFGWIPECSTFPGFTKTHRDQCDDSLMGIKTNFFLKMLIFFFSVQDWTLLVPSSLSVE